VLNPDPTPTTDVSIGHACRVLGLQKSWLDRAVATGDVSSRMVGRKQLVSLVDVKEAAARSAELGGAA
jgi:hypothetical protein